MHRMEKKGKPKLGKITVVEDDEGRRRGTDVDSIFRKGII